MTTNVEFKLKSSNFSGIQKEDLLDLVQLMEANKETYLSGSPLLYREKGEPITLASFALGITVASVPVILSALVEWLNRKRVTQVEIEATSGDQKVRAKFYVTDREKLAAEVQKMTKQLQSVLKV